jgi:hypothetical protein
MQQMEGTIDELVSGAFSDLEELGQEMQDWFDNMPENLQDGSKGDAVSEAADGLSNISAVDTPESLATIKVKYAYDSKARSRSDRRDNAINVLNAVIEHLESDQVKRGIADSSEQEKLTEEYDEFLGDLQNARDEAEGVEFPGMMG